MPPLHRTVASVVYSTSPSDVTHTIVGGEVIYENGGCAKVDEGGRRRRGQRAGRRPGQPGGTNTSSRTVADGPGAPGPMTTAEFLRLAGQIALTIDPGANAGAGNRAP